MKETSCTGSVLSNVDIQEFISSKDIVISPMNNDNITPLGYNLSFTKFIYSINRKILTEIYEEKGELYCYIEPNDTVLIMSHEAVWISNKLVGTFHSKVGIVSQGLGHISTTLDPEWEGPLLFSLNNPTNKKIKLTIGETISGGIKYKSFVTLILYTLITTP
jgi:deoxycytidine triphosphate deaminase